MKKFILILFLGLFINQFCFADYKTYVCEDGTELYYTWGGVNTTMEEKDMIRNQNIKAHGYIESKNCSGDYETKANELKQHVKEEFYSTCHKYYLKNVERVKNEIGFYATWEEFKYYCDLVSYKYVTNSVNSDGTLEANILYTIDIEKVIKLTLSEIERPNEKRRLYKDNKIMMCYFRK